MIEGKRHPSPCKMQTTELTTLLCHLHTGVNLALVLRVVVKSSEPLPAWPTRTRTSSASATCARRIASFTTARFTPERFGIHERADPTIVKV